jgi:hypothetical protein
MTAVALAAILLSTSPAAADPCARRLPGPPRPASFATGDADFASTPAACPHTAASVAGRGTALVDTPDFYGTLLGEVVASGAWAREPDSGWWLTASVAALEWRFAQNATIAAARTDLGPATIAGHFASFESRRVRVAPLLRALLPTGTRFLHAVRGGLEPGLAAAIDPGLGLRATAGLSTPIAATVLGDRELWDAAGRASADLAWAPWSWFEVAAGLDLRAGNHPDGALESVSAAAALRFAVWRGLTMDLAGVLPLAGVDRTDLRVLLGAGWTFGS